MPKAQATTALLPVCRICGNESSGFHYGAYTCEGCKVFYRRSLRRNITYKCQGRGCHLDGRRKRGLCQACRFRKCEELGMSVSAIRHGRYTYSVRTANLLECNRPDLLPDNVKNEPGERSAKQRDAPRKFLSEKDTAPALNGDISSELGTALSAASTQEDQLLTCAAFFDLELDKPDATNPLCGVEKAQRQGSLFGVTAAINEDQRRELENLIVQLTPLGVAASSGTSGKETKTFLKKRCEYFLKEIGNHGPVTENTIDKMQNPDHIDESRVTWATSRWFPGLERGALSFISLVRDLPVFDDLPLLTKMQLVIDSKNEVWVVAVAQSMCLQHGFHTTIELHTSPILELFGHWDRTLLRLLISLVRRLQQLQLSDQENALVVALIILSSDRGEPDSLLERSRVEQLYERCLRAMQYLIEQNRPYDALFFPRLVQILTDLRTYNERAHDFFASFKKTWPQVEATGIVNELFLTPTKLA